ncbi:MAG: hypothetical protein H6719_31235 [Sandaracinaceae bacterium]|nr:hypothetical protein [Sandaracinaceae bacterium]
MLPRWLALVLLATACGEAHEVVSVEPVDEPAEVTPAPAPAPPSADLPIEERTLPAGAEGAAFPYDVPRHPNPRARARLEELLTSLARDTQRRGYEDGTCRVVLGRAELVSVICRGRHGVRGGEALELRPTHFAIAGDEVEPFALEDAFLDGVDLHGEIHTLCQAELARRSEVQGCWEGLPLVLGPDGVVGQLALGWMNPQVVPIELAYDAVRDRVLPGGPLAAMLGVEGDAPAAAPTGAFAVSRTTLVDELLETYAALPRGADDGAGIRVQALGPSMARLVATSGGRELADRIAASLDAEARPVERLDSDTLATLRWARAREPLRVSTEGRVLSILPTGSIVLTVGELRSGAFEYVTLRSPLGVGYVEGAELSVHSGCVPSPPRGFSEGPSPLTAITRAYVGRRERDVVLFAATGGGETRVAIHDLRVADCSVGPERASFTAAGELFHVQLQSATEAGGPTLVVVGTNVARTRAHYRVRALGADHDAWEHDIGTHVGVGYMVWLGFRWRQGGWMPVSYQLGGVYPFHGLRWTDGGLEDVGPVDQ